MSTRERSQSRVLALQALCLFDVLGDEFSGQLEAFLRDTVNHSDLGWSPPPRGPVLTFARELAMGAFRHRDHYDALLTQHVPDWSVRRMQTVDRNILRLGLHELQEHPETPPQVVLNEAVELAREFGSAESPAFVNGVLDGVWRATRRAAGVEVPAHEGQREGAGDGGFTAT